MSDRVKLEKLLGDWLVEPGNMDIASKLIWLWQRAG